MPSVGAENFLKNVLQLTLGVETSTTATTRKRERRRSLEVALVPDFVPLSFVQALVATNYYVSFYLSLRL